MELLTSLFLFLRKMLKFFTFPARTAIPNGLSVYVKSNMGDTVFVELDPSWEIKNLKDIVSKRLGVASADEIKIIFAGKELQDNVTINVCSSSEYPTDLF